MDWQAFSQWFRLLRYPNLTSDDATLYSLQFNSIDNVEEDSLSGDIFKALTERAYAKQLIELSANVIKGECTIDEAQLILDECQEQLGMVEETENDPDHIQTTVDELISTMYGENMSGLTWPLKEMNLSLGPLRVHNAVLVAAYVNSGKTSLLLYCVQHMALQLAKLGKEVYYFANEEAGTGIMFRFVQSMIGWTSDEMANDPKGAVALYNSMYDSALFKLYYNPTMSTRYIEQKLRGGNPGLIIIDQLYNIAGFEKMSNSNVDRYTELAKWARRLSAQAPCMFTHQADGTCNGAKWIEMNQLYGSKVGIQGAVDAVITLGNENGSGALQHARGLYFPKNKLPGGPGVDKDLRQARWDVLIDPERCRFKGAGDGPV